MEADLDHDGKISFEEFTKMVENTDVSMSMTLGMLLYTPRATTLQATITDYHARRPILDGVLTAIPAGRNLPGVLSETLVGCWEIQVHRQHITRNRTTTFAFIQRASVISPVCFDEGYDTCEFSSHSTYSSRRK